MIVETPEDHGGVERLVVDSMLSPEQCQMLIDLAKARKYLLQLAVDVLPQSAASDVTCEIVVVLCKGRIKNFVIFSVICLMDFSYSCWLHGGCSIWDPSSVCCNGCIGCVDVIQSLLALDSTGKKGMATSRSLLTPSLRCLKESLSLMPPRLLANVASSLFNSVVITILSAILKTFYADCGRDGS